MNPVINFWTCRCPKNQIGPGPFRVFETLFPLGAKPLLKDTGLMAGLVAFAQGKETTPFANPALRGSKITENLNPSFGFIFRQS